jgi:hypothetical protein
MRFFAVFALLFASLSAFAADSILSSYELNNPDADTIASLARYFDIEHAKGNSLELIVPREQAALLAAIAPRARLVEADTAAANQARLESFRHRLSAFDGATGYHTLVQVQNWMRNLALTYPFVKVVQYGTSAQGRPLLALHVNTPGTAKPVLMITAATHGDELITTEVTISLITQLLEGYGNNPRFTQMIDRHDLYFVPVLNVDGFVATRRYDGNEDPNRSYPYPGHESARPTASISGIIKLFEQIHPAGSIDFHAYGELTMYPWGYTHDPVEAGAKARFDALTKSMSEKNHYTYGPIADVIYVAPGSSADYYFWKAGTLGLGIEMGNDKIPDPAEFPAYIESQTESTWRFIEAF